MELQEKNRRQKKKVVEYRMFNILMIVAFIHIFSLKLTIQAQDLSDAFIGNVNNTNMAANSKYTYRNPFQQRNTSEGIEISFKINHQDNVYILGAVFAIVTEDGAQYLSPGSYLGYNGTGGWYDANLTPDYTLVKSYMKAGDSVKVQLLPDGFRLYVNDILCYDQNILYESDKGRFDNITGEANGLYKNALETISKEGYLQFGFGSWWNVYGWDEAKLDISNAIFKLQDGTVVGKYFMEDEESEELYHSKEVVPVTGMSLDEKTIYLDSKGATAYINANIMPKNASNQGIMWKSTSERIATIDKDGKITAIQNGTIFIHATSKDGGYRATGITVVVTGCEDLVIKKKKFSLTVGKKGKINANASEKISYQSLNKKIATVSSKGIIKAKAAGKAVILVKSGNEEKKVRVTVKNTGNVITIYNGMKLSKTTVSIKKGKKLTMERGTGVNGKITFRTLNKKIATVSVKGVIKAKKRGKTAIVIKNGRKTVKLKIIVKR